MDLVTWVADYADYMQSNGYASRTMGRRLKHLRCLNRFATARGMKTLEEFDPELASDLTNYWVCHQPGAQTSAGFRRACRFQPHHHIALQYSLRSFFRWAHATGRLHRDVFPWKPAVRGGYFFPEVTDYLRFCEEHKGLAKNSWVQTELFVRRFDQFLHGESLSAWNQIQSRHIDLFVRRQASHNIGRIQLIHSVLRGLFRYLFSLGRLDRDWAAALLSPRRYQLSHTPCPLTVDQVLHLLRSIDRSRRGGKRNLAMILMAASLGVRASEIAALCLEDLDWVRAVVCFPPIKGKNDLPLPLSRPLIEALADYFKNERPSPTPYRNVFMKLTPPLGPLGSGSVSTIMGRIMCRAGIRGSGHKLRHAFANELLKSGMAFSTLQELLGHSHFTSTQVYTKIDLAQLREVAKNDAEDM